MSASQLLKILHTRPSDVKDERCVFDPAEQNMTMKENQNATIHDPKSFTRETDGVNYLAFDANRKVIDDFSVDNENGSMDSPRKDDQNIDSLFSDVFDENKKQISLEDGNSTTVEEFTHCNGNESKDSSSQRDIASDLFETVTNVFTDKNVLEYGLPELEVMKDICVDDGKPQKDINLIESVEDDKSGHLFLEMPNDNKQSESIEASSLENAENHAAKQCEIKEENDAKLIAQENEVNFTANSKAATNSTEEDSLVDQKLPIQEYGTRSFLRSFLGSLDGEDNKLTQSPDQLPIGKAVSEGPTASSTKAQELEEKDVQASSMPYNSKVESGTITFNFSDAVQVQSTTTSIANADEQSLVVENKNSDLSSANSKVQCVNSKNSSDEIAHDQSSELKKKKDGNSDDLPSNDIRTVEPKVVPKHERGSSGNASGVGQWQYDEGETSFSAVTYSGPIAFSGSLSHRSDASTTSARSFAFPVLQSEWNSSPVRMAKADRRNFRKHRGWRSGLLCCRF